MTLQISHRDLDRYRQTIDGTRRAQSEVQNYRSQPGKISRLIQSLEVGGSALVLGIIESKYRNPQTNIPSKLFNIIPIDLAIGIGLQSLAYAGIVGRFSPHFANLGNGALVPYFFKVGMNIGKPTGVLVGIPSYGALQPDLFSLPGSLAPVPNSPMTIFTPMPVTAPSGPPGPFGQ